MLKIIERYKWCLAAFIIGLEFIVLSILKSGFYVDEIYSYGHANSTQGAFLDGYATQDYKHNQFALHHRVLEGKIFHDYLTVQENERFSYQYINENLKQDVHPPFYFWLLHTVCSFTPDTFSKWSGLILNVVVLMLLLCLFYRLARLVLDNDKWAYGATFFLAFLPLVMEMSVYVRMYLLEMAFFTGLLWQTFKYLEIKDKYGKNLFIIFCFALLCFLTHFYGLIYVFFLAAGTGLFLLRRKQYRKIFVYAALILSSIVCAILIYPAYVSILLFSERGEDAIGVISSFDGQVLLHILEFTLVQICQSLFFIKGWSVCAIVFTVALSFCRFCNSYKPQILLFTGLGAALTIAFFAPNMGAFNGRYYVGAIIPLYLVIVYIVYKAAITYKIKVQCLLIGCFLIAGINFSLMLHSSYLERKSENSDLMQMIDGKKVILQRYYYISIFKLAPILKNAQKIYITTIYENIGKAMQDFLLAKDDVVIFEAGQGGEKYPSKQFLAQNEKYHLRYQNMYLIDNIAYDVYVATK